MQWRMGRNCSLAPRQAISIFVSLGAVSLLIGCWFLSLGAPWVMYFAGLEVLALAAAFIVYARHASDHETLTLCTGPQGLCLRVEQMTAGQCHRTDLPARDLAFDVAASAQELVGLRGADCTLRLGRFVRPEWRAELRRALVWHLQQARCLPLPKPGSTELK